VLKYFEDIANGEKKRVIVNIAAATREIMNSSHILHRLGSRVSFRTRKLLWRLIQLTLQLTLVDVFVTLWVADAYKDVFPNVELQADSKSASRWGTNHNGEYFAIGVGGALAGRGADLFIIDDPHSEQDAKLGKTGCFSACLGVVSVWSYTTSYAWWCDYCCDD
jgi:hypothetical protein